MWLIDGPRVRRHSPSACSCPTRDRTPPIVMCGTLAALGPRCSPRAADGVGRACGPKGGREEGGEKQPRQPRAATDGRLDASRAGQMDMVACARVVAPHAFGGCGRGRGLRLVICAVTGAGLVMRIRTGSGHHRVSACRCGSDPPFPVLLCTTLPSGAPACFGPLKSGMRRPLFHSCGHDGRSAGDRAGDGF